MIHNNHLWYRMSELGSDNYCKYEPILVKF